MSERKQRRIPAGRSKAVPQDILALEATQGRCPSGHLLPHKTNKGRCTPLHCAGSLSGASKDDPTSERASSEIEHSDLGKAVKGLNKQALAVISAQADSIIDAMIPGDSIQAQAGRAQAKAIKAQELTKLSANIGRYAAMRTFFKAPDGLSGAEAEEWVKRRAEILSVDAVVDLERDLKLGDDHQRREARRDLLDMAGLRKRESLNGGGAVIMLINQNGAPIKTPLIAHKMQAPATATITLSPEPRGPKGTE